MSPSPDRSIGPAPHRPLRTLTIALGLVATTLLLVPASPSGASPATGPRTAASESIDLRGMYPGAVREAAIFLDRAETEPHTSLGVDVSDLDGDVLARWLDVSFVAGYEATDLGARACRTGPTPPTSGVSLADLARRSEPTAIALPTPVDVTGSTCIIALIHHTFGGRDADETQGTSVRFDLTLHRSGDLVTEVASEVAVRDRTSDPGPTAATGPTGPDGAAVAAHRLPRTGDRLAWLVAFGVLLLTTGAAAVNARRYDAEGHRR